MRNRFLTRVCLRVLRSFFQLAALWVATGVAPRATAARVAVALAHSHACVAAHARTAAPPAGASDADDDSTDAARAAPPPPPARVLVGFARTVSVRLPARAQRATPLFPCISSLHANAKTANAAASRHFSHFADVASPQDGEFAALVTDVAVCSPWRRRGVGRELLRRLLRATAPALTASPFAPLRGGAAPLGGGGGEGPGSIAAFPPPTARAFFACVPPHVCPCVLRPFFLRCALRID
jgi:hypothetical protein